TSSVVRMRAAMASSSPARRWTAAAAAGAGLSTGRGGWATPGVLPPNVVRLPNMDIVLVPCPSGPLPEQGRQAEQAGRPRRAMADLAAGDLHADGGKHFVGLAVGRDLGDHLAVIG